MKSAKTFTVGGYFTENRAKAVKAALEGKSFFNWKIDLCNLQGNFVICVSSDYDASLEELKENFYWAALNCIK